MRERKSYPKSFKIKVVQECEQPGVSVADIAMTHGINAYVARRWIPLYRNPQCVTQPAYIPLKVAPGRKTEALAIIELPLGQQMLTVKWPISPEPMDMRTGTDTALARVNAVFGAAKPRCAYLFANLHATRIEVLVHDGFGIWLAARRLNQGEFH